MFLRESAKNSLSEAIRLCREKDDKKSLHEALYEAFLLECLNEGGERQVRESMIRKAAEDAAKEEMTEMQDVCSLAHAKMKIEYYDDPNDIISGLQRYSSNGDGNSNGTEQKSHWKYALSVSNALLSSLYLRIGDVENSKRSAENILAAEVSHGPCRTQAICNLAMCCFSEGQLEDSLKHLKSLSNSTDEKALLSSSTVHFQIALIAGKAEECFECCRKMATVHKQESVLRNAEVLLHIGERSAAVEKLNNMLDELTDKFLRTRCLLLLSQAYLMIKSIGPCLHFLQEAHTIAKDCHIGSALLDCKLTMAKLKVELNLVEEALALLNSVIPLSKWDESRIAFLHAYALLSKIAALSESERSSCSCRNMKLEAISHLNKSKDGFRSFNAFYHLRDVEYMMSVLHDDLGNIEERNECARHFNELLRDYPGNPIAGVSAL